MQGDRFVGYLPDQIRWSADSKDILFRWNPDMDTLRSQYKLNINDQKIEKVSLQELKERPSRGDYNADRTQMIYGKNGDIFLLDLKSMASKQLTNTLDRESNPQFTTDGQQFTFVKSNNLFVFDLAKATLTQLTNLKRGKKRPEGRLNKMEQWLEDDQLAYFDILEQRNATRALRQEQREELRVDRPLEIYYGQSSISNLQASPNLRFVTFRMTKSSQADGTIVPNFVTESGYTKDLNARPKVGSAEDTYEMGVYDRQRDTFYRVDTKQIEGIYNKPAFLEAYHTGDEEYNSQYENPREVIFHGPYFSDDSQAIIVVRSMDNKDRWILELNLETGNLRTLDWQHDDAWIGGPGISGWNFSGGNIGWYPDNQHIWFQSEESGFSHLYKLNISSGKKEALTKGNFEILDAFVSNDNRHFYITSNKETPHEQHFYKMPVNGGKMEKITEGVGNHNVSLSPDEKYLAIRYSSSNQPWELYLMENKAGATRKKLTSSTTANFQKYDWRKPEIVRFTAADGAKVPARLYTPDPSKKNGAAVIFVHGAGYLQNVHEWWSSYYREYMFHNILADNGYTVLDIDYRASAGYGRDWRTAIYQFMGGKDLSDQVDGAKYLAEAHGIDSDRIGIYGGSYGGFITLMGMFTSPGTFKSGAALRSVTDWAHYNHPYTSNILNTPVLDPEAYRKSSPLYHAEGLEGNLLILHGMVDTNVQFQDVVRLSQRLIELGKDNWELAVFPMEGHGFVEASSWADEYKRIFKLFQSTLKQ
jgi:dipeptidyl aminopeptidase/acylaminoacyl peptidase